MKRIAILALACLLAFAIHPGHAQTNPTFYPLPGGAEHHLLFSDGVLYLMTPGAEGGALHDLYAFDAELPDRFRLVYSDIAEDDYPFILKDHVYAIARGERVMRLLQAPEDASLPKEIGIIPADLFPPAQSGSKWDEPSHFLLSIAQGDSLVYLVTEEPGDIRSLCYLDIANQRVKAHKVGTGLFGFARMDAHNALYYVSDNSSTPQQFYHINQLNWQTGEVTHRGELPSTAWGIAYDAVTDSLLYVDEGTLYRHTWQGSSTPLMSGLTERRVDPRGFVLADRSLAVHVIGMGQPDELMVIRLDEQ